MIMRVDSVASNVQHRMKHQRQDKLEQQGQELPESEDRLACCKKDGVIYKPTAEEMVNAEIEKLNV